MEEEEPARDAISAGTVLCCWIGTGTCGAGRADLFGLVSENEVRAAAEQSRAGQGVDAVGSVRSSSAVQLDY